jgi:hypothetical protein
MAVCISISIGGRPGANERDLARVWLCSSSARRRRKAVVRSSGDIVREMPNLAGQHERQPEASRHPRTTQARHSLPLSLKPTPSNNPTHLTTAPSSISVPPISPQDHLRSIHLAAGQAERREGIEEARSQGHRFGGGG